jgi:hypothetical protein
MPIKHSLQWQREVAILRAIGRHSQDSYNNSQFSGFASEEFMLELRDGRPKQLYTLQPLNDSRRGPQTVGIQRAHRRRHADSG